MGGFTGGHEPVREDEHTHTRTHKHTHTQILKCQQTNQQTQDTHTGTSGVCALSLQHVSVRECNDTPARSHSVVFFHSQ